jgi:hypothetical protein
MLFVVGNMNQNFDAKGQIINTQAEETYKIWGVTDDSIRKWPNRTQEWLTRLLGLVLLTVSLLNHFCF